VPIAFGVAGALLTLAMIVDIVRKR
jgi:hypothetical protein